MAEHKDILSDGAHILHRWKVADQAELDAIVPTVDEVDKVALKNDDGTYWRLVTHSPITWKKVGATASEIKTAYESNADTNALTDALLTLLTTKKVKDVTTDAVNDKLVITYTDDTVANLNINDIVTDVYVSGATLDATTNVLTLTSSNGGADVTVNLSDFVNSSELASVLSGKQDKLISGDNIKSINGVSLLGSGNIVVGVDTSTERLIDCYRRDFKKSMLLQRNGLI